jgi:hypothetical protein
VPKTGPEQVQQRVWTKLRLLDHLVGTPEQLGSTSMPSAFNGVEVHAALSANWDLSNI